MLAGIAHRIQAQDTLEAWVRQRLPPEQAGQVVEVLEQEGAMTVFAASAAWAGRLRYGVEDLKGELAAQHPRIKQVRVKVMPRRSR